MRMNIYLTDEEYGYVKTHEDGWVRSLVVDEMGIEEKKDIDKKNLIENLPAGVVLGPKEIKKEPGYCVNGHWAGGMKTCKLCGGKVR